MKVKFKHDFFFGGHLYRSRDGVQDFPDEAADQLPESADVVGGKPRSKAKPKPKPEPKQPEPKGDKPEGEGDGGKAEGDNNQGEPEPKEGSS